MPHSDSESESEPTDISLNVSDTSFNFTSDLSSTFVPPEIVTDLSSTTITGPGYEITNSEGKDSDGDELVKANFDSTNPELYDPDITQDLSKTVEIYDDLSGNDLSGNPSVTDPILDEIKEYASQLQCSDFHGKGSIDDYTELFQAASRIANETKQMELDVDITGFNDFANAADELSELFNGFILKLNNVSIITDVQFLTSILNALKRIVNLSETFGKFKQTVFSTTTIQLPKSANETKLVLDGVMDEINCAMQYVEHFVAPTDPSLSEAALSPEEKQIIKKSVETIDNWNALCEHGVSIAMSDDENIQSIKQMSIELNSKSASLSNATATLKQKLTAFNIM